ncbi:uncharacterized protein B0H18DRAFT_1085611 [Fomitopsis serialis]|uniref:uncharacterized protein n=1 Tax=Fomitopsis serialis TaxID=139415 RepID=UPI0020080B71|nr:uncharacterized protein B0H18DRAFT_1085611 [Neoantrodia serialis]KAH9923855.1 hypothetical protein B0H18DRAFT_1085611 [Neoantrodia serialis]
MFKASEGYTKRKPLTVVSDDSPTPPVVSLAEQFSYNHLPRPFKNPEYTKNTNRRTKNLRRRQQREEQMDVDGVEKEYIPDEDMPTYSSIEAPPSVLPQRRYCDITGLEGPYTDPATGLRYHDKSVYDMLRGLSATAAKDYLAARGVNPIVK